MNATEMFEHALQLAVIAHKGQTDRYGAPYILHPLRVMARVDALEQKTVAILHDIVEDTAWTLERLQAEGFSADIIEAVDCLTKREGEPYDQLIARAARNELARKVKEADLQDNLDVRRADTLSPADLPRLQKYLDALATLRHQNPAE